MKTILITGVSSGTGLGITKKLLQSGFQVIGSVRKKEKADELQKSLGENFIPLIFDICKFNEIDAAAKQLGIWLGNRHLHALINNAGTAEIGPLLHVSREDFRRHMDVLVCAQLYVIQKFYKYLIPTVSNGSSGSIYNMSSISGTGSNYLFGSYATGKHALEGLSKTLRQEMKIYGIKVIVVAPGNIATSIWKKQTPELIQKYKGTAYYKALTDTLDELKTNTIVHSMTIDEFSDEFIKIIKDDHPAFHYTIVKTKNHNYPWSKEKIRVMKK
jgi:NAD(P)-dependent dehydrogenase (short-subunit alcohol dehydrogenase family)